MRIRLHAAALVVLLTGCQSAGPVLPEVAKPSGPLPPVIVAAPCVTDIPAAPAYAVDALPKSADEFQRARALIAERIQRQQREAQLLAILVACKGP